MDKDDLNKETKNMPSIGSIRSDFRTTWRKLYDELVECFGYGFWLDNERLDSAIRLIPGLDFVSGTDFTRIVDKMTEYGFFQKRKTRCFDHSLCWF